MYLFIIWTLFSFHPLKFSLLLYLIDSSLLLESLLCFVFKDTGPFKCLLPPSVLFTGSSSSAPSPLAIHRILLVVLQFSYIVNLGNLIYLPTQIFIYILCTLKFSPSFTPKVCSQLPTGQFQPYLPSSISNLTCLKFGSLNSFSASFFFLSKSNLQ